MARIVLTHSTYLKGLIRWAKNLSGNTQIQTITPGVIGKTKGHSSNLMIRITRKTNEGYKLIARKGSSYQEVYIVTELEKEELDKLI